ncbi:MAG: trehalose-phosphatase [Gemmatimonadota bacterium]|nr:trehalose-phosphatase [Gemmatimonadota bacterium]
MRRQALPPPPALDWALFLDLDGTLVELAEAPRAVRVEADLLALLKSLREVLDGAVALVSGRSLSDLDRMLGISQWPAAGQHGLEIRRATGQVTTRPVPSATWGTVRESLWLLARRHPGLLLEEKGLSLALHYRQAPRLASHIHRVVRQVVDRAGDGLRVIPGRRVIEVTPAGASKGEAVDSLMATAPFLGRLPVFVGDDVTDEEAFSTVRRHRGVSVKVGPGPTAASHRLPDVAAVRRWLAQPPGSLSR